MPIEDIALRLLAALLLGSVVGVERQWRQRSAGLRTNALVALGAAGFALIGLTMPGESSPTRMAAQVVSGIGFLGAGAILRQGLNVRGLNTAATLWCSAAVGVACGAGMLGLALLVTLLIVVANLVLRPIIAALDRAPMTGAEVERAWRVTATCTAEAEAAIRLLLLKQIALVGLRLHRLETEDLPCPEGGVLRVALAADLSGVGAETAALEGIVGRLSLEPSVTRAGWAEVPEAET